MNNFENFRQTRKNIQIIVGIVFAVVLITGWFYPLAGLFIPFCMFGAVLIAFFKGRKWCDWLCPRGSFFDAFIAPLNKKRRMPNLVKNIKFRILILIILMSIMTVNIILAWPDINKTAVIFVRLLTVTTLTGIMLGLLFHERVWCWVCPVGTISSLIGKDKNNIKIDAQKCVDCSLCRKNCPMDIKPDSYKSEGFVKNPDCLKCNLCISVCPKNALKK